MLFPRQDNTEAAEVEVAVTAGEEDLRCAACNTLLALPRDLLLAHSNSVGQAFVRSVWRLLERSAAGGEVSPATGSLLALASMLINAEEGEAAAQAEEEEEFSKRVTLILHFVHNSSSDIRRTAVETLNSLLSLRLPRLGALIQPSLFECIFEQLFHRILLEVDTKIIRSVTEVKLLH